MARKAPPRKPSGGGSRGSGGGQGAGILRFYTDDAPGLKMCAPAKRRDCFAAGAVLARRPGRRPCPPGGAARGHWGARATRGAPCSRRLVACSFRSGPTTVLVLSLLFIAFVVLLHIWGKFRKG